MIKVQTEDFDLTEILAQLKQKTSTIGAISTFIGIVRDQQQSKQPNPSDEPNDSHNQATTKPIKSLWLEHYPPMTEQSLQAIAEKNKTHWNLDEVVIIHRVGELKPGDNIVLVVCSAPHRGDTIKGMEAIINQLKVTAFFWKKENYIDGTHQWLKPTTQDLNLIN